MHQRGRARVAPRAHRPPPGCRACRGAAKQGHWGVASPQGSSARGRGRVHTTVNSQRASPEVGSQRASAHRRALANELGNQVHRLLRVDEFPHPIGGDHNEPARQVVKVHDLYSGAAIRRRNQGHSRGRARRGITTARHGDIKSLKRHVGHREVPPAFSPRARRSHQPS